MSESRRWLTKQDGLRILAAASLTVGLAVLHDQSSSNQEAPPVAVRDLEPKGTPTSRPDSQVKTVATAEIRGQTPEEVAQEIKARIQADQPVKCDPNVVYWSAADGTSYRTIAPLVDEVHGGQTWFFIPVQNGRSLEVIPLPQQVVPEPSDGGELIEGPVSLDGAGKLVIVSNDLRAKDIETPVGETVAA